VVIGLKCLTISDDGLGCNAAVLHSDSRQPQFLGTGRGSGGPRLLPNDAATEHMTLAGLHAESPRHPDPDAVLNRPGADR